MPPVKEEQPTKTEQTLSPPSAQEIDKVLADHSAELLELRWDIHRNPCLSGDEQDTADRVQRWLKKRVKAKQYVENLGETG